MIFAKGCILLACVIFVFASPTSHKRAAPVYRSVIIQRVNDDEPTKGTKTLGRDVKSTREIEKLNNNWRKDTEPIEWIREVQSGNGGWISSKQTLNLGLKNVRTEAKIKNVRIIQTPDNNNKEINLISPQGIVKPIVELIDENGSVEINSGEQIQPSDGVETNDATLDEVKEKTKEELSDEKATLEGLELVQTELEKAGVRIARRLENAKLKLKAKENESNTDKENNEESALATDSESKTTKRHARKEQSQKSKSKHDRSQRKRKQQKKEKNEKSEQTKQVQHHRKNSERKTDQKQNKNEKKILTDENLEKVESRQSKRSKTSRSNTNKSEKASRNEEEKSSLIRDERKTKSVNRKEKPVVSNSGLKKKQETRTEQEEEQELVLNELNVKEIDKTSQRRRRNENQGKITDSEEIVREDSEEEIQQQNEEDSIEQEEEQQDEDNVSSQEESEEEEEQEESNDEEEDEDEDDNDDDEEDAEDVEETKDEENDPAKQLSKGKLRNEKEDDDNLQAAREAWKKLKSQGWAYEKNSGRSSSKNRQNWTKNEIRNARKIEEEYFNELVRANSGSKDNSQIENGEQILQGNDENERSEQEWSYDAEQDQWRPINVDEVLRLLGKDVQAEQQEKSLNFRKNVKQNGDVAKVISQSSHQYEETHDSNEQLGSKITNTQTADIKQQWEIRDGDVVRGGYTLYEEDGTRRIIEYTADDKYGFSAKITKIAAAKSTQTGDEE